jgi:predicted oxidoreductase
MQTDDSLIITRTRRLGEFEIGRLAYGCWRFGGTSLDDARAKVEAALEIGANLIDTADVYGYGKTAFGEAEERLGDLLAATPGLRERIVLVTKGGVQPPIPYDSRHDYLIGACESSLRRLKTDVIDLYFVHRPDLLASHQEVAEALTRLRRDGKVRELGVSNYTVAQTRALQGFLDFSLAAIQPEISAWVPDALLDGTLDYAQEARLTPMAWSPLAGGALATGIVPSGESERFAHLIASLDKIAEANTTTRDAIGMAWLLAHPAGIVPIIGSQSPERIRSAADAYAVTLTRRQWYSVLEARLGRRMP